MNCCCYHLLYLKIPCLLDVSFFLKVTPVLTFSPAHFSNSINVEQCCYIVGNVFCSVCAVCDMQKFLPCTVLKFFACLKLHRAVFSKLFCLWNLTNLKKEMVKHRTKLNRRLCREITKIQKYCCLYGSVLCKCISWRGTYFKSSECQSLKY